MSVLVCLLVFLELARLPADAQDLVLRSNTTSNVTSTQTTTVGTTTTPAPATILDSNLPAPTSITKVRGTTNQLTLSYTPPPNYRTDPRFSHFLVEYKPEGAASSDVWFSKTITKTSNPNALQLSKLRSGVLYSIRMRSIAINGNRRVISLPSATQRARTKPPAISNLKVKQSSSNWTHVFVTWDRVPQEIRGHEYNRAVLTYYIEGLTVSQQAVYPRKNKTVTYVRTVLGSNVAPQDNLTVEGIVFGAPYVFDVVMYNDAGVDPTKSHIVRTNLTTKVPGPVKFRKLLASETILSVVWEDSQYAENVTGYRLIVSRFDGKNGSSNFATTSKNITLNNLHPGSLYVIRIAAERNDSDFGRVSENYEGYARTVPSVPRNVSVVELSEEMASVQFTLPSTSFYSHYYVTYQTADNDTRPLQSSEVALNNTGVNQIINHYIADLKSGALYNFTVTTLSRMSPIKDMTSISSRVTARTVPPPPVNFEGSSARGTIYLKWGVPPKLYWIARAHYVIDYYPEKSPKNSSRTCQNKGQNVQQVTLRNLQPGTAYQITIKTVAGSLCNSPATAYDDVTSSSPAGPITVLTQPNFPSVQFWEQVTLNSVRLAWNEPGLNPDKIDKYVIDVEKRQSRNGSKNYRVEDSIEISKNQTYYDLNLAQGSTFRINITTAVLSGQQRRRSMVVPGVNSINVKTWDPYNDHFPYPSLRWTFSTCRRTGRFGPLQSLCDLAYKGTSLENLVIVENGIQRWRAPVEGLYRIVAAGAGYQGPGGLGATVSGLFSLKEGDRLHIAVGQVGRGRGTMLHGGAGATYVVADDVENQGFADIDASQVMLVAGGAGSAVFDSTPTNQSSGRLSYDGGNASYVGIETGRGGMWDGVGSPHGVGGEVGTGGGAGMDGYAQAPPVIRPGDRTFSACGYFPNKGNGETIEEADLGDYLPLQGGRYERSAFLFSEGGFGGGGAGYMSGSGGGGGYSGGGGGPPGGYSGGGGSFIKFTGGQELGEISNNQAGFVVISVVGLPATPPVPLTLYLVIAAIAGIVFTLLCGVCLYGVARCTDKYLDKQMEEKEKTSNNSTKLVAANKDISGPIHYNNGEAASTSFQEGKSSDPSDPVPLNNDANKEVNEDLIPEHSALKRWRSSSNSYPNPVAQPIDDGPESDSESTASSVSSMATGVNEGKFVVDTPTGKLRYRGRKISRMNSSFTGFESTDAETSTMGGQEFSDDDEDGSLPPPPPTPPLTPAIPDELVSEEQKQDFRQKLNMFHEMALRSRGPGAKLGQPTFVPSTNL